MWVTDAQVKKMRIELQQDNNVTRAAMKAGIDRKTARRYRDLGDLPSEHRPSERTWRTWRTCADPFDEDWPEIATMLQEAPGLEPSGIESPRGPTATKAAIEGSQIFWGTSPPGSVRLAGIPYCAATLRKSRDDWYEQKVVPQVAQGAHGSRKSDQTRHAPRRRKIGVLQALQAPLE